MREWDMSLLHNYNITLYRYQITWQNYNPWHKYYNKTRKQDSWHKYYNKTRKKLRDTRLQDYMNTGLQKYMTTTRPQVLCSMNLVTSLDHSSFRHKSKAFWSIHLTNKDTEKLVNSHKQTWRNKLAKQINRTWSIYLWQQRKEKKFNQETESHTTKKSTHRIEHHNQINFLKLEEHESELYLSIGGEPPSLMSLTVAENHQET